MHLEIARQTNTGAGFSTFGRRLMKVGFGAVLGGLGYPQSRILGSLVVTLASGANDALRRRLAHAANPRRRQYWQRIAATH